jgi:hypothetical protein
LCQKATVPRLTKDDRIAPTEGVARVAWVPQYAGMVGSLAPPRKLSLGIGFRREH